jgi:amidase
MFSEQEPLYGMNLLGLPSVAVPTGIIDGLPTGVQIVGRKFREDQCFDAAQAVEEAVGTFAKQIWD